MSLYCTALCKKAVRHSQDLPQVHLLNKRLATVELMLIIPTIIMIMTIRTIVTIVEITTIATSTIVVMMMMIIIIIHSARLQAREQAECMTASMVPQICTVGRLPCGCRIHRCG